MGDIKSVGSMSTRSLLGTQPEARPADGAKILSRDDQKALKRGDQNKLPRGYQNALIRNFNVDELQECVPGPRRNLPNPLKGVPEKVKSYLSKPADILAKFKRVPQDISIKPVGGRKANELSGMRLVFDDGSLRRNAANRSEGSDALNDVLNRNDSVFDFDKEDDNNSNVENTDTQERTTTNGNTKILKPGEAALENLKEDKRMPEKRDPSDFPV